MSDPEKTVFISYRRSTGKHLAGRICDNLRFHGYDVFLDVDTINSGKFDNVLIKEIAARRHFVIILASGALERCSYPDDWLRREIEEAMRLNRNIVPVIDEGFSFDEEKRYLPASIVELPNYSGVPLYHAYFEAAMDRLRNQFLKQPPPDLVTTATQIAEVGLAPFPRRDITSQLSTKRQVSAEQLFNRAHKKQKQGDLIEAIADYTEAIRLNPQYAEAYNNRGVARKDTGDIDGAIADFEEVIRLIPNDADVYTNRGVSRYEKGDLDGAIADYTEAIRLNPDDVKAYNNRGNARTDKGDLDGAIADFTLAIYLSPHDPTLYNGRGVTLKSKGNLDEAIADFTEAIRLNQEYPGAYNNRGNARFDKGDFKGAIADYRRYLELGGGKQYGNQDKVERVIQYLTEQST